MKAVATPCRNCGKLVTPSIPFIDGHVWGLISPSHGCPKRYDQYVMRSANNSLLSSVKKLLKEQV